MKGVSGPATCACVLVPGDVGPEPPWVVGCEHVSNHKAEGDGGGVVQEHG